VSTDTVTYVLASLRRASDNAFPWSLTPHEAGALVAEVERLRALAEARNDMYLAVMDTAYALAEEDELEHGWRPPRGKDELVDRALDVREERDRLRSQRILDNEDLARAYDFARDKATALERQRAVAWLRSQVSQAVREEDLAYDRAATIIENGDHVPAPEKP
jgi:hypothetical protein